jgi:hypothetical protein
MPQLIDAEEENVTTDFQIGAATSGWYGWGIAIAGERSGAKL